MHSHTRPLGDLLALPADAHPVLRRLREHAVTELRALLARHSTQQAAADALGVHRDTLRRWLRDHGSELR